LFIVVAVTNVPVFERQHTQQLTWAQASPLLPGYHVELHLTDGTRVSGRAVATTVDAVTIESVELKPRLPRYVAPRKPATIPRRSIAVIKRRKWGTEGNAVGAGVGGAVAAPFLHGLGEQEKISGGQAFMIFAGVGALGAWIAHRLGGPTLVIQLVPAEARSSGCSGLT
jgi:hypothetical protein